MTKEDAGHYAKKHLHDSAVKPEIEAALKQLASDGEVPCAVAFKIAADLDIKPGDVGITADLLEMRLIKCQLGLFGYQPKRCIVEAAKNISKNLEEGIRGGLEDGKLPCLTAWRIAKDLGIRKMEVSSACEALEIKICSCQIGAF